ncbi:MAG: Gfo/Idh/MocA family oxidoreductase [Lachnospiraceae bacterium]|nr:Gfo/Idh/MocA family oxidoreductase [Lachnospiraceae bacterium]
MEKARIAICGSRVKPDRFGSLIKKFEDSELAAVWDDQNIERCEKVAEDLGVPFERDIDNLLNHYRLDGVVIVSDNARKKDLILKAAQAGISVFVEKPMCVSAEDAKEIQKAVHESGIKFYMSDPFVSSGLMKVKELIAQGELGRITGARFLLGAGAALYGFISYDREKSLGGIMADVGGHMIHQAHYIFGKPEALSAQLSYYSEEAKKNQIEENAVIVMRYPDDVLVTLNCSWLSGAGMGEAEIYGTGGVAVVQKAEDGHSPGDEVVVVKRGKGESHTYSLKDMPKPPRQHIRYFIDMLVKDLPNDIVGVDPQSNSGVSIDHAVEFAEIIDTIYQSANKGFIAVE